MTTIQQIHKDLGHAGEYKVLDEARGIVEADVNSMGILDADNDIITPEAFNESIYKNLPIPVLTMHDQSSVVGKVLSATVIPVDGTEHRLRATMQMNLDTQLGRDAFSNIKGEFLGEYSVGFNMKADGASMEHGENGQPVRVISNVDWVETSIVVRGASPNTQTISAKSEEVVLTNESEQSAPDATEEVAVGTDKAQEDEVRQILSDLDSSFLLIEMEEVQAKLGEFDE